MKKYKFYYWFAFPAIHCDPPWTPSQLAASNHEPRENTNPDAPQGHYLNSDESATLTDAVQTWSSRVEECQRGFFLARKNRSVPSESTPSCWQIASLAEYEKGFFTGAASEDCYICFADPSNFDNAPGWMLRNLLVVVQRRWGLDQVQILQYRDTPLKKSQGRSMVIRLESRSASSPNTQDPKQTQDQLPKITGWERNPAGKLAGRIVNLTEYMDPTRYGTAIETADLMKCPLTVSFPGWRTNPWISTSN